MRRVSRVAFCKKCNYYFRHWLLEIDYKLEQLEHENKEPEWNPGDGFTYILGVVESDRDRMYRGRDTCNFKH